jgi:hypothetical protein
MHDLTLEQFLLMKGSTVFSPVPVCHVLSSLQQLLEFVHTEFQEVGNDFSLLSDTHHI